MTSNAALQIVSMAGHSVSRQNAWLREQLRDALQELAQVRSELEAMTRVASLSALTASIAHEIKQPLAGIVTNAGTGLRMLACDPPNLDGAREAMRRALRDAKRADDVIVRVRALFSKKAAVTEPVDLNDAMREVLVLSLPDLQLNGIVVRAELAEGLPEVLGDRVQLQQVIVNLVLNACEAMTGVEDRQRLLVVRTEIECRASVRVSVTDVGVGIRPEDLGKVFDAFYTTKTTGMGVGLAVSRSIVERHGGRLHAAHHGSEPGATVWFSIPFEGAES